jgi:hypothetical protein
MSIQRAVSPGSPRERKREFSGAIIDPPMNVDRMGVLTWRKAARLAKGALD